MCGFLFAMKQTMRFWLFLTLFSFTIGAHAQMQCFDLFSAFKTVQGEKDKEFLIKRAHKFSYLDKEYDFEFTAELDNHGVLALNVQLINKRLGIRSYQHGPDLYAQMIEHFGLENINAIEGVWGGGTNFDQFNGNLRRGMGVEEAAANTWSGRQAARYGFTKIKSYEFTMVQESEFGDIPYPIYQRPFSVVFTRP
jgi:hypothetical protein